MSTVLPSRLAPRSSLPFPGALSLYVPVPDGIEHALSRVRAELRQYELPDTPLHRMAVHTALQRLGRGLELADGRLSGGLAVFTTLGGEAWTSVLPLDRRVPFRLFVDRRPVTWPARAIVHDPRHLDAVDARFAPADGPLGVLRALR